MSMFSFHIFLFPFSWERKAESDSSGKQVSDIHQFSKDLGKEWTALDYKDSDAATNEHETKADSLHYNELKYFHQFAHSAIFEDKINPANTLVKQFEYLKAVGWKYKITFNRRDRLPENESIFLDEIPKPPDNYTFKEEQYFILNIKKVTLDLYTQGVGIFAFHLENSEHPKPEDILLINQFGRRIYPPFLDTHFGNFKPKKENSLDGTKYRELPVRITIKTSLKDKEDKEINIEEDYTHYAVKYNPKDIYLPGHIAYFFQPETEGNTYQNLGLEGNRLLICSNKILLKPILDDRMFVISWYGSERLTYDYRRKKHTPKEERKKDGYGFVLSDLCQRMRGGYEVSGFYRNDLQHRSLSLNQTHDSYGYASNDFWYQYVFVDGFGASCANSLLRTEQIEKHTYSRWVENNTLYGITRYSFVCITEPQNILEKPFPNAGFIIDHIQTIYFRMVSLVLAQRAMILKFSADAIKVCENSNLNDDPTVEKTEKLLVEYTRFINQFFHREITAQEQGIELYDRLQEHLRVEYQAKELEKEIDELHRNADLIVNRKSGELLNSITIMGGIFLIPSLLTAFIEAGLIEINDIFEVFLKIEIPFGRLISTILVLILANDVIFDTFDKKKQNNSRINKSLKLTLGLLIVSYLLLYGSLNNLLGFGVFSGLFAMCLKLIFHNSILIKFPQKIISIYK